MNLNALKFKTILQQTKHFNKSNILLILKFFVSNDLYGACMIFIILISI